MGVKGGMVSSYVSGELGKTLMRLLENAEKEMRKRGEEIRGALLSRIGFVDGSYVFEERRGACLALFSAASLEVVGGEIKARMRGNKEPVVHVVVPKSYSESRIGLLMSILELLAAINLLRSGVEAVFLDGSYVSALMMPFGFAQEVYRRFNREKGAKLSVVEEKGESCFLEVTGSIENGEDWEPRRAFIEVLNIIGRYAGDLYRDICEAKSDEKALKEALDFSVVYMEETAYLSALRLLLKTAEDRKSCVFWVAKDSESRYLTEREGLLGWLSDVMLLDYAWKGLGDVYVELTGVSFGKPKGLTACRKLIDEVYDTWNEYSVVYFKLGKAGIVSQMTYPTRVSENKLVDALATLSSLSDRLHGYPRPLNYVHNLAVLNPSLPRILADELYKRLKPDDILRFMLTPSGRRLLGLV